MLVIFFNGCFCNFGLGGLGSPGQRGVVFIIVLSLFCNIYGVVFVIVLSLFIFWSCPSSNLGSITALDPPTLITI